MEEAAPRVSVVIPLLNKEPYIARTLRSVLQQSVAEFELIVVDGGSTDGSVDVVKSCTDPRVRLVLFGRRGVSRSRNAGIAEARTDLVAFLDADDEWEPDVLSTFLRLREAHPEAGAYAVSHVNCEGEGRIVEPEYPRLPPPPFEGIIPSYFLAAALSEQPVISSAVAVRGEVLREIGGFPEDVHIAEDLITWFRVALRYPVAFSWRARVVYHMEASNRTAELAEKTNWMEQVIRNAEEALRSGAVPPEKVADVVEYICSYRILLAQKAIYAGHPERAREVLAECRTRHFLWEKWKWRACAGIPPRLFRHLVALPARLRG